MSLRNTPHGIGDSNRAQPSAYLVSMTLALLVAIASAASFAAPAPPVPDVVYTGLPSTPLRTYVADGTVNAIVRSGDTVYIGGQFSRVGPRTGPGVEVALDGSRNAGLPEISGSGPTYSGGSTTGLRAVISDGAGGWYISGIFSHVGGIPRTNVAHILVDHSIDPAFNPLLNGSVVTAFNPTPSYFGQGAFVDIESVAVSGSVIYAAGSFDTMGGQSRSNLASVNA